MTPDLLRRNPGERTRWFSPENPDGRLGRAGRTNRGWKGRAFVSLPAGESLDLVDVTGSGRIARIWLTLDERGPDVLAGVRLEAWWDGASTPAVSVPLGDFFLFPTGTLVPLSTAVLWSPEGRSFGCSIPMPFRSAARLALVNDSGVDVGHLFYEVDVVETSAPDPELHWFHARLAATDRTSLDEPFAALPYLAGSGRLLGMGIGVSTAPEYADTWWGEGEVRIRLDDEPGWSLSGTGLEDHVGSGWGLGTFQLPDQGCTVADPERGRWALYRFHLADPVWFETGIAVDLHAIGGAPADQVRGLLDAGVELRPITVDGESFARLLDDDRGLTPDTEGWVNFARRDAFRVTSYLTLDGPGRG